ncbi:alkaline phosphatase family protein [Furfurilactobacillus curtus]|uniref:Uncharacterized protein n=1 Tax=Furfurilactobacillus curtus TaxID=1746200 RepID=A0ABQ5JKU6_9LACO
MVVIPLDAMGAADLRDHLHELPQLTQLVATGTYVKKVSRIYPTLTYRHIVTYNDCRWNVVLGIMASLITPTANP